LTGIDSPFGIAVTPDGTKVYVTSIYGTMVYVIDTGTNIVTATVHVGENPRGVAVTPDSIKAYVADFGFNAIVAVINTTTNTVTAAVPVGFHPSGVAVSPDGTKVYVTNYWSNFVSVIDTATNNVTATVSGFSRPYGVAVTPDGTNVYVANYGNNTVYVINTATDTVTATVNVGTSPKAFGQFIGKAIPTITWSNPANITYGTALSGTQLDATASVPGNFVYTPPLGTVLNAGPNQQLNTIFTPTDITNYTTASKTVYINVIPAVQSLTITKTPNPLTYSASGQTITYTYTVKNTGNVDISAPITVTDDKFGTVPIQSSGILSPGLSVTGTATYKITDADINTGYVANLASATGSFNNQPVISPQNIVTVLYKQPTNDRTHNDGFDNGDYGGAVVPVVPIPMMYSNSMYGSEPNGYGNESYGYTSGPSTTEIQDSESNVHKDKAHLSKHKHKHHPTKHHPTGKKSLRTEKLK
jgi:YVTN family beta-propeller protein